MSEEKTKIVYAASGGSYSDYQVYALFSSKADAETYVEAAAGGAIWEPPTRAHGEISARPEYVEEFALHEQMPQVHLWWQAKYHPLLDEVVARAYSIEGSPAPKRPLVFKEPPFGDLAKAGLKEAPVAWCADKEAAVKSVKDRLAALKAAR